MAQDASLSAAAGRVQAAFLERGLPCRVVELSESTRSAEEAAAAIGCNVAQLPKSLVFRTRRSKRPVLVLASGSNRVDPGKLRRIVGERIGMADAAFVREHAGFATGGIPPLGHPRPLRTVIDCDLLGHAELWAAAGTPHAVFALTPRALETLGEIADVKAQRRG